jgi:hypothetical protein
MAKLKTIQGWETPVVCHCDEVVRDCFRCMIYFETRAVRRRGGAFLAGQGFFASFEEFIAVRDSMFLMKAIFESFAGHSLFMGDNDS